MSPARRLASELVTGAAVVAALAVMAYARGIAQGGKDTLPPKPSTLPNPYRLVPDWPTLPSTIGLEKKTNPFLRTRSAEIRRNLGLEGADDVEVFAETRRRKDKF